MQVHGKMIEIIPWHDASSSLLGLSEKACQVEIRSGLNKVLNGLTTLKHAQQNKTSLTVLVTPTIPLEHDESYFYPFSDAPKTWPTCAELSPSVCMETNLNPAVSVLKSVQTLVLLPYETNIGYFKLWSQIKNILPKHIQNFNPNPDSFCQIISNLIAITHRTQRLHRVSSPLKGIEKSPKANRTAMSKMDRSCDGFNLGSSSMDLTKRRGNVDKIWEVLKRENRFFMAGRSHRQRDNYFPFSNKTRNHLFQTHTLPKGQVTKMTWTQFGLIDFQVGKNWPVVES